LEFSHAVTL
jgi:hypothetical protein